MKGQTHGGKGSTPRPTNKRRFDENYEAIFNKKANEERVELDEGVHTAESDGRQRESKFREHVEGAGIQRQADQEQAVAWMYENCVYWEGCGSLNNYIRQNGIPLYTSTLKRQPLSNDEIAELWGWKESGNTEMIRNFARAIEKAHGIGE
jgi:uncharacterized protein with von Willebrand factor type A (vWA) domain